jgi:hypothetical protein
MNFKRSIHFNESINPFPPPPSKFKTYRGGIQAKNRLVAIIAFLLVLWSIPLFQIVIMASSRWANKNREVLQGHIA